MSDLVAMHFPPEMIERLRVIVQELTTQWGGEIFDQTQAASFAAGAIMDKVCLMAGEISVREEHPGSTDVSVAMFAASLGVGNILAADWCCAEHAIGKLALLSRIAHRHAIAQHQGDQSELETADCKGTA